MAQAKELYPYPCSTLSEVSHEVSYSPEVVLVMPVVNEEFLVERLALEPVSPLVDCGYVRCGPHLLVAPVVPVALVAPGADLALVPVHPGHQTLRHLGRCDRQWTHRPQEDQY